ncbi:MAG: flagellar basal body-associated FliL family protein [Candidatus Binatia bacterium]
MALLKNKLVLIIVVVLLLGGGGAYYFLVMGKPSEAAAKKKGHGGHDGQDVHAEDEEHEDSEAHAGEGDEGDEDEEDDEESGGGHGGGHGAAKSPAIDPFVVNLADPGSRRYLRVNLKLKLKKQEESEPLLEARMPQVRDAVLMLLSGKTTDQLLSVEGKTMLRKELIDKLNAVLKKKGLKKAVKDLYFTEFLIQ